MPNKCGIKARKKSGKNKYEVKRELRHKKAKKEKRYD